MSVLLINRRIGSWHKNGNVLTLRNLDFVSLKRAFTPIVLIESRAKMTHGNTNNIVFARIIPIRTAKNLVADACSVT
jgi:hypothetical protein